MTAANQRGTRAPMPRSYERLWREKPKRPSIRGLQLFDVRSVAKRRSASGTHAAPLAIQAFGSAGVT